MQTFSFYLTENRLYIYYKNRSANFVQAIIAGFCDSHTYESHEYTVWAECRVLGVKPDGTYNSH